MTREAQQAFALVVLLMSVFILGSRGCPQAKPERLFITPTPACGHMAEPKVRFLAVTAAGIRVWAEVREGDTIAMPRGTHSQVALCCEAADAVQAHAGAPLAVQGATSCTRGGPEVCCTRSGELLSVPDELPELGQPIWWGSLKWTPIPEE